MEVLLKFKMINSYTTARVIARYHSMFNYSFVDVCVDSPGELAMVSSDKRDVWRESLSAMKASLVSSYEFQTLVDEERRLISGLKDIKKDYVVFSSYRRNAGKRRIEDIKEMIDSALDKIDCCDSDEASRIYLNTLKSVMMHSRWASVLETLSEYNP